MDVCPSVDELETYVTLTSNNKIKKLAEQLGVPVSRRHLQNLKEEKLRHVFQQWLESKNAFATRHGMIEALQAINEHDMAKTYLDSITSYLKSLAVHVMDGCPNVSELLDHVTLSSNNRTNKLAKHLNISLEKQIRGKDRLEKLFKKWIENKDATRKNMIEALQAINEKEIAFTYSALIFSVQKHTDEFSSLFKNVQKENAMVETCVMQCMPLGPPRVGKTCLKKRLLQEKVSDRISTTSTPIVEEKQTILVESPSVMTLEAKGSKWKSIPWENEVIHLVQKFKNSPQTLYNSLASLDAQKSWDFHVIAFSLILLFYAIINQSTALFLKLFAFISAIIAISEFSILDISLSEGLIRDVIVRLLLSPIFYLIQSFVFVGMFTENTAYTSYLYILLGSWCIWRFIQVVASCQKFNVLLFLSEIFLLFVYVVCIVILMYLGIRELDGVFIAGLYLLAIENITIRVPFRFKLEYIFVASYGIVILQLVYYTYINDIDFNLTKVLIVEIIKIFALITAFLNKDWQDMMTTLWYSLVTLTIYWNYDLFKDTNMAWVSSFFNVFVAIILLTFIEKKRVINIEDRDTNSNSIIKTAIEDLSNVSSFMAENNADLSGKSSLKIYFTDSGGQPEFQEVLPALLSGPTVFFLVFNLSKGFNAKYHVEYVADNSQTFRPYKTQFTVLDALLQCLATISCLGEFSKTPEQKSLGMIKPKVFFVGTHQDLTSKDVISRMEKELRETIESTTWYKKDMIQFASAKSLIFAVNNFDKSDSTFIKVRKAIEVLSQTSDYSIMIRAPWLGLELTLRSLKENVISLSECIKKGEKCSIRDKKQLNEALWFLHNKVGSIRHYQQIPELKDIVIIRPQVLFTIVTNLLVGTFPFADGKANARFHERGRFTREEIIDVGNINKTGLTVTQVIALLSYLHIIAPLKVDHRGNREYFLPCALSHAPKPDQIQLDSKGKIVAPVLLVGFKCGYTPKGVFGGLISYMLQKKHFGLQWSLDERCLFRDQATFIIGDTGYCLTMTYLPKYLQLEFREPHDANRKTELLSKMKSNIQTSLKKGLHVVQQRLNYTCNTDIKFGFNCSHSKCINNQVHPAFFEGNNMNILTCSKQDSNTIKVDDEQLDWFLKTSHFQRVFSKATQAISFLTRNKTLSILVVISALILFIFVSYRGVEFDIRALQKDQLLIKKIQWNHYNSQCQLDPTQTISCELAKKFSKKIKKNPTDRITPIRFPMNTSSLYTCNFEQLTTNCSLVLIILFDKCHPKDCSDPMQEIKNSLREYFNECPLSDEVCWPLVHHFTGFHLFNTIDELLKIIGNNISHAFKMVFKSNSMLHFYYQVINYNPFIAEHNQCTTDLIKAIRKKSFKIEQLQDILEYVMNTEPILAPMIILKNIDKAFQRHNKAMEDIVIRLSTKTSDTDWLVPIVATTSDNGEWFESTTLNGTLVNEYFPTLIRPQKND